MQRKKSFTAVRIQEVIVTQEGVECKKKAAKTLKNQAEQVEFAFSPLPC
jgi:hypothetical protein